MAKKKKPAPKKTQSKRHQPRGLSSSYGRARVVHITINDEIDVWLQKQPEYFNMSEYVRKLWKAAIKAEGKASDTL